MVGKGTYLGGSSIIRPTAKPNEAWLEEHEFSQRGDSYLTDAQIERQTQLVDWRISETGKRKRTLLENAKSRTLTVIERCQFPQFQDPRTELVRTLILQELMDLFFKMRLDIKDPFAEQRVVRWEKLAEGRARLIWKHQMGDAK